MQLMEGRVCVCVCVCVFKKTDRQNRIRIESVRVRGSNKDGRGVFFSHFLNMAKDSAAYIELGKSFHQMGIVNEKFSESDFVPLWDGTIMCRSLAEHKILEDT